MTPLTREQTAGTLTFFFPCKRDAAQAPEVTLMVRRVAEDEWHAGLAQCSQEDMFSKRLGRKMAFHRLQGAPLRGVSPDSLLDQVLQHIDEVRARRRSYTPMLITTGEFRPLAQRLEDMRIE